MNWPFKNKLAVGKMALSVKGVMMSKHISMVLLCILTLFLTSCPSLRIFPIRLVYGKPGICASSWLSGGQRLASVETLAGNSSFHHFHIEYDDIEEPASALSGINLLFGGKSINLANVRFEDVEGITPDKPCRKLVDKAGFDDDPTSYAGPGFYPYYTLIFHFYGNGGEDDILAGLHFHFDKDKHIRWIICWTSDTTQARYWTFENTTTKTVFEPPLKLDELKVLFGADARIFKSLD